MAVELNKNKYTYGVSYNGMLYWRVGENKNNTICFWSVDFGTGLNLSNNYTEDNLELQASAKYITKAEFNHEYSRVMKEFRKIKNSKFNE